MDNDSNPDDQDNGAICGQRDALIGGSLRQTVPTRQIVPQDDCAQAR
jgi:hypothetical protein